MLIIAVKMVTGRLNDVMLRNSDLAARQTQMRQRVLKEHRQAARRGGIKLRKRYPGPIMTKAERSVEARLLDEIARLGLQVPLTPAQCEKLRKMYGYGDGGEDGDEDGNENEVEDGAEDAN